MWSIAKLGIIDRPKMQTFFEIGASGNPIQLDFRPPRKSIRVNTNARTGTFLQIEHALRNFLYRAILVDTRAYLLVSTGIYEAYLS